MVTKKENLKIDFSKREKIGTGACRKLRNKQLCPVVLYGPEYKEGLPGTVATKSIYAIANSKNRETTLIDLVFEDGNVSSALIRDVQRHPITQQIRHIDLYQVLKGHKIKIDIPINIVNEEESQGIKDGGILMFGTRLVSVEIQPSDILEQIDYDIKELEIGSEVYVRDIVIPENSELLTDPDALVLHIAMPKIQEEEVESEEEAIEEASAEVEVISKGKDDSEE